MKLHIIGTGCPDARPDRYGSAFGLEFADELLLVDCITGTPQVIAVAGEAGVKRVVLTHASPNFEKSDNVRRAVDEVRNGFDGEVLFPKELSTVEL